MSTPDNNQWTIQKIIHWTTNYFKTHNVESPRMSAEVLLAYALNLKRIDLYLKYDQPLNPLELSTYKKLIKRRVKHEPVAYITGTKEFWSKNFIVGPKVLIPRPDTECLVETTIDIISNKNNDLKIIELGTGSGAAILSIASEKSDHKYFATDISESALDIAKQNAKNLNIEMTFLWGSWFDPILDHKPFDIIISNPPYIKTSQIKNLQPEISIYEPLTALDGGSDGLKCINKIIQNAYKYLNPDGYLLIETGFDQKDAVCQLANNSGQYKNITYKKDYSHLNRLVIMEKNS